MSFSYDYTLRNLDNAKILYESGAISQQELKNAEVALKSINFQLEDIKDGTPDYMKNEYIAGVEQAVILRDSVKRGIEKQQVLALIDGIIIEKLAEENSIGATGMAAFLI